MVHESRKVSEWILFVVFPTSYFPSSMNFSASGTKFNFLPLQHLFPHLSLSCVICPKCSSFSPHLTPLSPLPFSPHLTLFPLSLFLYHTCSLPFALFLSSFILLPIPLSTFMAFVKCVTARDWRVISLSLSFDSWINDHRLLDFLVEWWAWYRRRRWGKTFLHFMKLDMAMRKELRESF